jgi:AcrR family transcriptional regulator
VSPPVQTASVHRTRSRRPRRSAEDTRGHILGVAHDLFHFEGIRATGIDLVAERAQVAPATLYRLFGSKDELVAAYVARCSDRYRAVLHAVAAGPGTPEQRIIGVFEAFAQEIRSGTCRGCPFLMTLAEYPDPSSAPHRLAVAHKAWLRELLRGLTRELSEARELRDPQGLADRLALVADGMYGSAHALGAAGPAAQGLAAAEALIDAALRLRDRPSTPRPDRDPKMTKREENGR